MTNKILISVDAGKGETKYCFKIRDRKIKDAFATRGRILRDEEDVEVSDNNFEITYENNRWGIGDSYTDKDNNNSKNTDLHKIAIYTAITNDIEPNTDDNEVILTVTAPATLANNKDFKTEFANNLKGNVNITVNDKKYNFTVVKVAVRPEGTGALYKDTALFKSKNVLSIDLGYLNLNACAINRLKVTQDSEITDTLGMQRLHTLLNDALNKYNDGRPLNVQKLNDCLDTGYYKKGKNIIENSEKEVLSVKEKFLEEVLTSVRTKHFTDDYDLVVFSGATSKVIKDVIENTIDNAQVIEDAQFANVEGNYNWMDAKLN
ncbi:putative plasmid segregation protein (plasmid) [Clostridium botulinum C/D str. BKT12695]|nr:putative plasmid segregation protein [Clostridium botulinum C/D str. BKT12695]